MLSVFAGSLLAVFLAEMGDKTQLLAMAFATRFRWQTVLLAILAATLLNHLLAVIAGSVVCSFIPIAWVKLLASVSFLAFSLWILHDDAAPCEVARSEAGPFMTVALAFFLAEMGDKTQIMTMTLSADHAALAVGGSWTGCALHALPVWLGTTAGMMVADGIGIAVGVATHKRMPTRVVKWVAAIAFAVFGLLGLRSSLGMLEYFGSCNYRVVFIVLTLVLIALMGLVAWYNAKRANKPGSGQQVK